ncbi:hypothetical protein D3C85_493260 [compost metagenome]
MKLSRIIELCLVHTYIQSWFMCNAVENLCVDHGLITFEQVETTKLAIEELMLTIDPTGHQPMVTALVHAGYLAHDSARLNLEYMSQLYVWWVFDLKNKGL